MDIEIYDNGIEKEDCIDVPYRTACRGIVIKDDKYLVVHLLKHDITTFPGGGLEENETLEECVVREVLEETGILCKVIKKNISVTEYFIDSKWTNVYFTCDFVKDTNQTNLVPEEVELQLVKEWKTLDELLDIFENNMTKHEYGPNIHNREFLGLINSI
ncbi:RNA pyrophosphohydrolase [Candidatus Izimaplasma bacterium HR1]|jgi:8-oxo-dGTP pyrophosphatase MutT (NUDIX family)|uniref:NUDIX hydrolase n=1 Tax=Candidatus Izimoplasma sp. HR1 TaxID=1541959 RepID=UPI0004F68D68|nr:RNA pyrophosphohydrolase [Candidatus Izimaplasma bacterium HR1]